jgi:uncharacterized membrane protein YqiK
MADFDSILGIPISGERARAIRRRLITWGVLCVVVLVIVLVSWNSFFEYVPQGKHLVIISKSGDPLPPDQVLAREGEKGILEEVKGEGWHFVMPVLYETELAPNTEIKAGKVGIVNSRGGKPLPAGRLLAEPGEKGIQRRVLPPGTCKLSMR